MAKIKDNTNAVLAKADELVKKKLELASLLVERSAKENCPVKTGTLRRSITRRVGKRKARVGSNVEYAPFVEMGTRKMPAQPYLRPALESNRDRIKRLFGVK